MIELKKCPKCGCEAEIYSDQVFSWCDMYYKVRCKSEYCDEETLKWDNKYDAINEWNKKQN